MNATILENRGIACWLLLEDTFSTHDALINYPQEKEASIRHLCSKFNIEYFALFIAVTNKCLSVGKYAVVHNHRVDQMVINSDFEGLKDIINAGIDDLIEFFDNPYLTENQKNRITEQLNVEFQTVKTFVENFRDHKSKSHRSVRKRVLVYSGRSGEMKETIVHQSSTLPFISKCRARVCLENGKTPYYSSDSTRLTIRDIRPSRGVPEVMCFDIVELLDILSNDPSLPVINPRTNELFSDDTLFTLQRRYAIEISIYRYAKTKHGMKFSY